METETSTAMVAEPPAGVLLENRELKKSSFSRRRGAEVLAETEGDIHPWKPTGKADPTAHLPAELSGRKLRSAGVQFTQPPVELGPVSTAVLDDTCGNLIQIAQTK